MIHPITRTEGTQRRQAPEIRGRIVVVDRCHILRLALSQVVQDVTGQEAQVLIDGAEAIDATQGLRDVQLLIIELERYLPSAVDTIRRWRAYWPASAIIAMSYGENAALATDLGCAGYLERPFRFEALADLLRTYAGAEAS